MFFKDFFFRKNKRDFKGTQLLSPYVPEPDFIHLPETGSLAYVDVGDSKTPLVLVHGLGTYIPSWYPVYHFFQKRIRCIAPDLPNYGLSEKGNFPFTIDFFASALELFIEKMKLNKVVLAGHSMGGQIAIELALRRPDLIEGLILLAPAGFETFAEHEAIWIKSFSTPDQFLSLSDAQVRQNFYNSFYRKVEDAEFMLRDRLSIMDTAYYPLYCKMISRCFSAMLDEPVFHRLSDLKKPVQVIFGRQDGLIPNTFLHPTLNPFDVAKNGVAQIPSSRLAMINNAGHMLMWDQPQAVNEAIDNFLSEII